MPAFNEVRIRNISPKRFEQLKNIANHYGETINDYVKQQLSIIIDNMPVHIKEWKEIDQDSERSESTRSA